MANIYKVKMTLSKPFIISRTELESNSTASMYAKSYSWYICLLAKLLLVLFPSINLKAMDGIFTVSCLQSYLMPGDSC